MLRHWPCVFLAAPGGGAGALDPDPPPWCMLGLDFPTVCPECTHYVATYKHHPQDHLVTEAWRRVKR